MSASPKETFELMLCLGPGISGNVNLTLPGGFALSATATPGADGATKICGEITRAGTSAPAAAPASAPAPKAAGS